MTNTTKYTVESIKCYPLNRAKLEQGAKEAWGKDNPHVYYELRSLQALVTSPKLAILDNEFVGNDVNPAEPIKFYFYRKTEYTKEDGSKYGSFEVMPSKGFQMGLEELRKGYLLPETTLAEFTKERRGYNSRIISNEAAWIRHFNS